MQFKLSGIPVMAALVLSLTGCSSFHWTSWEDSSTTASSEQQANTSDDNTSSADAASNDEDYTALLMPEEKPDAPKEEETSEPKQGLSSDLGWFPNLDQPLQQLNGELAQEKGAKRAQTLQNLAYLYDAQLFVLFQDMLDFLPEAAEQRELKEQNDWLSERKKAATQAFLTVDDANAARFKAGQTFIRMTQDRIQEIKKKRALVVIGNGAD